MFSGSYFAPTYFGLPYFGPMFEIIAQGGGGGDGFRRKAKVFYVKRLNEFERLVTAKKPKKKALRRKIEKLRDVFAPVAAKLENTKAIANVDAVQRGLDWVSQSKIGWQAFTALLVEQIARIDAYLAKRRRQEELLAVSYIALIL